MTSTPDERLLAAHDVALAALHEITRPETVGDPAGYTVEPDGVVSLRFANRMPGYPGWFWTVSVAVVEGAEPTVLEAELLPGEGALLAPEWVPWAVRLAEYQAQQAATAGAEASGPADGGEADEDATAAGDDDLDDDDDIDDDDLDIDVDLDDSGFDPDAVEIADDDLADLDDEDLDDLDGVDDDDSPILHSGDLDGVDIDELDDSADYDDESE